jgi:dTDP-4-dehydrorhamnose 3,5-epimerase
MRELGIKGAFIFEHRVHGDSRGSFREWYKKSLFEKLDIDFDVSQANHSISEKNVLRGVHYSIAPAGQHKLVTSAYGDILDVLIDLRVGSPTYLRVEKVLLSHGSGNVLFVPTGVGHSFLVVSDLASVVYLTSSEFDPENEKTISPLDPELALGWSIDSSDKYLLSDRDKTAPKLAQAVQSGHLPMFLP